MDTLHDRLSELADDAPTGGAPPAELWARGKRAHRLRATALAATLLVVGAVGTGIGVRLADADGHRSDPAPARTVGIALPIDYPVVEELPALGDSPGPLAAIWLVPASGEVVGLVAETGTFGTLPFDVYYDSELPAMEVALSPDGRRIAYPSSTQDLVVRDLVSGEDYSSAFVGLKTRRGFTWVDATHLVGHTARGSDIDGWVWQPGEAPKSVNLLRYPGSPYLGPHAGREPWFLTHVDEVRSCSAPTLKEMGAGVSRPVLCDVLGVIGPEIALTHDRDGTVVALDIDGVEDPALRRVVVDAGAPQLVTFATDLIREALDAGGGAS